MMFSRSSPNKKKGSPQKEDQPESSELPDNNMPRVGGPEEEEEEKEPEVSGSARFENEYLIAREEEQDEDVPSRFGYPSNRIISNGRVIAN